MPINIDFSALTGRDYVRMKVRNRDNFTCQNCGRNWNGSEKHFDVHHLHGLCGKKSRSYDKIKEIDNLITLCHRCHYHHHSFSRKIKNPAWAEKKERLCQYCGKPAIWNTCRSCKSQRARDRYYANQKEPI